METVLPTTYERWRRTRLGATTEHIELELVLELAGALAGCRVLDVGCGDGIYTVAVAERGAHVVGVDVSDRMLDAARLRAVEHGVEVQLARGSATSLPFKNGAFDLVLAVTVLCFIEDAGAAVGEMARVLAPGGKLVLGELNRWSVWAAWRRTRGWLGSRTWQTARFHSARELSSLAADAGLQAEPPAGAVYYPPVGMLARLMAPLDPFLRVASTFGSAFVAIAATRPASGRSRYRLADMENIGSRAATESSGL